MVRMERFRERFVAHHTGATRYVGEYAPLSIGKEASHKPPQRYSVSVISLMGRFLGGVRAALSLSLRSAFT